MFGKGIAFIAALLFLTCGADRAWAQQCPTDSSAADIAPEAATLHGRLVHHDGIRRWFELELDRPKCGQKSIQLTVSNDNWRPLEHLRGCHVESRGKIGFSPTGYYSLDLFQDTANLRTVGACVRKPPFPDYGSARPDKRIRSYRVAMHVDYRPGDHPITFKVWSGRTLLSPWQAYADYMLTGSFVLYGMCGKGFAVSGAYGTPAAKPHHDDLASFDPEAAAQAGKTDLHLGYSCIREH